MPKLLEQFLASIEGRTQPIMILLTPFEYVERSVGGCKPPETQAFEIDLGPGVGERTFRIPADPAEAEEAIASIIKNKEVFAQGFIDFAVDAMEEDGEDEAAECWLKSIEEIQQLQVLYPVFGFVVAYHEALCPACSIADGDDETFNRILAETSLVVAKMPEAEQELFVALGQHLAEKIFVEDGSWRDAVEACRRALIADHGIEGHCVGISGERILDEEACCAMNSTFSTMLHSVDPCPLAEGLGDDLLRWYMRNPMFMSEDLVYHVDDCDLLRRKLRALEQTELARLPDVDRRIYRHCVRLLTENIGSFFN